MICTRTYPSSISVVRRVTAAFPLVNWIGSINTFVSAHFSNSSWSRYRTKNQVSSEARFSPIRHPCSRAVFCRNSWISMPSPFTSIHAGAGSAGRACFGLCDPFSFPPGVSTGFALQGRVAIVAPAEVAGGVCACARTAKPIESNAVNSRTIRNLSPDVILRSLLDLRLTDSDAGCPAGVYSQMPLSLRGSWQSYAQWERSPPQALPLCLEV